MRLAVEQNIHSESTEKNFPWRVLLTTAVIWLAPIGIYAVYLQTSFVLPDLVAMLILLVITASVPFVALALYLVDKRRADGYISVWGYR